jgi:hypothetical protein
MTWAKSVPSSANWNRLSLSSTAALALGRWSKAGRGEKPARPLPFPTSPPASPHSTTPGFRRPFDFAQDRRGSRLCWCRGPLVFSRPGSHAQRLVDHVLIFVRVASQYGGKGEGCQRQAVRACLKSQDPAEEKGRTRLLVRPSQSSSSGQTWQGLGYGA